MSSCSLARFHRPAQPAPDEHHVIPQAWQRFWRPESTPHAVPPTPLPSGAVAALWDPRTVTVCPNHHRLVHQAIVSMMRLGYGSEDPLDAKKSAYGSRRLNRAQAAAYLALCRWREAGGSLEALRDHRLWGEQ